MSPVAAAKSTAAQTQRVLAIGLLGSLFIAVCTQWQAPMYPVPMTMQTFAVMTLAMALGPRLGVIPVVFYLIEGFAGLPVFSQGGGPAYIFQPSVGYLFGFLPAAWLAGSLAKRVGRSGWSAFASYFGIALAGSAVILASGFVWLAVLSGPGPAFAGGVAPFLVAAVVKSLLAALAVQTLRANGVASR